MRIKKISPVITGIIRTALQACEGIRFHPGSTCTSCGGTLSGYDEHKKRFAVLLEDDVPRPLHVIIQRSYCHNCRSILVPQEPFYPGTRVGSPVVDLCRSLSTVMPYSRASTCLTRMGVLVDRWSVRHYAQIPLPGVPSIEVFGLQIPASIIALSTFPRPGSEPLNPDMEDVLLACHYPFNPFHTSISWYEDSAATISQEKQKKITDGLAARFSWPLGIVILCFCFLTNLSSGIESCFPDAFLDLIGLDMDILSMNGVAGLSIL